MTSRTVPESTVNVNCLPEDIFSYSHEKFYEFIKEKYGPDISELLTFQAIRNGAHLLSASLDDILLIFQEDSEDINKLKELCCFPIASNKYQVKLGVKLAINNLIQSLKMKQEQQTKKKRSRTERPSLDLHTATLNNQTQPQNKNSPPSTLLVPSSNDSSPSPSTSLASSPNDTTIARSIMSPIQQKLNETDHKNDIQERVNNWWRSLNGDDNSTLDEGTDYTVEINKSINDTYACILTCKCHGRFKLSYMASGFFKLSSFCRHLKEKQCVKPSKEHGKENSVDKGRNSSASQLMTPDPSSKSSSVASKKSKTSTHTTSKRFRSPSTQGPSNTSSTITKKNRPMSENSTNTSRI